MIPFIDRLPANPGRILITPEDGDTPFYATVERADNPIVEGTLLDAENMNKLAVQTEVDAQIEELTNGAVATAQNTANTALRNANSALARQNISMYVQNGVLYINW